MSVGSGRAEASVSAVPRLETGGLDWDYRGPKNEIDWCYMLNRHQHLDTLLTRQLDVVEGVIRTDVAQLNQLLKNASLPAIDTSIPKREGAPAPALVP